MFCLIRVQATVLGDIQTQGSNRYLHGIHGDGHQRRCLLDSISGFQGKIRRVCVDCLRGRHRESSPLFLL